MLRDKYISFIAIAIAITALVFMLFLAPGSHAPAAKETAYERVLRTRTLRCGYAPWPVTEVIDPNTKQLKGLIPELTEALGQKLGLKIEWTEEIIWGQQTEALKTGRIDALCSTDGPYNYTSITVVDYTEPMLFFPEYIYGRSNSKHFENLKEINSERYVFSAIESDISLAMALDLFPKARRLELPGSADPSLIVMNVITGKADFVITDPLTIEQFNKNNERKLERVYPELLATINSSFSVGKGQADLLHMLNQGFQLLQQLGISDQILDRYDPERKLFFRPAKRWQ